MKKKHYDAIALIMMSNHPSKDSNNYAEEYHDFRAMCERFARYFASDNANFKTQMFMKGCDIEPDTCPECGNEIDIVYNCCYSNECEYMQ